MAEEEGDDFEIMPREQIKKLKEEISRLKSGSVTGDSELLESIKDLSVKLDSMTHIFEAAETDLREEDKTAGIVKDKIDPILSKVNEIADQNQKIAKGLVSIVDILEEKLDEIKEITEDVKLMQSQTATAARTEPRTLQPEPSVPPELSIGPGSVPPPPPPESGPVKLPFRKKGMFG